MKGRSSANIDALIAAATRLLRVVDLDRDLGDATDELSDALGAIEPEPRWDRIVWCAECDERPATVDYEDDDSRCDGCAEEHGDARSIARTHRAGRL